MAFKRILLSERVSKHAIGGPGFKTTIVILGSGHESRNKDWDRARGRWTISYDAEYASDFETVPAFFYNVGGMADSFLFRDLADFRATFAKGDGVVGEGVGTGYPTLQLSKKYSFGGFSYFRPITAPRLIPVVLVKKNGSTLAEGINPSNWEIDGSSGLVTFVATSTKNISAITKASTAVVTSAGHGFTNGLYIYITGVVGMTQVNGIAFLIGGVTTDTFQLTGINSTAYGTYTSGGTASIYPQPIDTLTAQFNFDVQVRFDTDELKLEIIDKVLGSNEFIVGWSSVPIIEVRPEDEEEDS